jgi:hypothetical protein
LGTSKSEWLIGVELDHPGNFWRVENPPTDWGAEGRHTVSTKPDGGKALRGAHAAAQDELEKFRAELDAALDEFRVREFTKLEAQLTENFKKAAAAARDEAIAAIEAAGRARSEKLDQFATLQSRKAESITQAAVESLDEIIAKKMDSFGKRCDELLQSVLRRNNSSGDVLETGKKFRNGRDEF